MHIRFIRSQALSALKKLQPALPRDNLIPQLSGIHLEADAERKEVTATARSTALAARISFPSKVEEAGSAVINGTLLCQLMEKFSGDDVDIQTVPSENAVLRSGRATFTLATLPSASYPRLYSKTRTLQSPSQTFHSWSDELHLHSCRTARRSLLTAVFV